MKITEGSLARLLLRCDSHIDAVMVNATDLRELVRGYRIGLATEAAPVAQIHVHDGRVSFHFHPISELANAGTRDVRIVPAELSGATTPDGGGV